jgi:hypothetical protein
VEFQIFLKGILLGMTSMGAIAGIGWFVEPEPSYRDVSLSEVALAVLIFVLGVLVAWWLCRRNFKDIGVTNFFEIVLVAELAS